MSNDDFMDVTAYQASPQMRRKFFALCKDLGIHAVLAKERVKKKYDLESFSQVTSKQLIPIISSLQEKIVKDALLNFFETFPNKESLEPNSNKSYPELLAEKIMKYFYIEYKND